MIRLNNEIPEGVIVGLAIMAVICLIGAIGPLIFFPEGVVGPLFIIGPIVGFIIIISILIMVFYIERKDRVLVKRGILLKNVCCDIDDYEKIHGKQVTVSLPPNNTVYTFNLDYYKIFKLSSSLHIDILFDPNNPKHFIAQDEIEVIGDLAPGRIYDFTPVLTPEAEAVINSQQ